MAVLERKLDTSRWQIDTAPAVPDDTRSILNWFVRQLAFLHPETPQEYSPQQAVDWCTQHAAEIERHLNKYRLHHLHDSPRFNVHRAPELQAHNYALSEMPLCEAATQLYQRLPGWVAIPSIQGRVTLAAHNPLTATPAEFWHSFAWLPSSDSVLDLTFGQAIAVPPHHHSEPGEILTYCAHHAPHLITILPGNQLAVLTGTRQEIAQTLGLKYEPHGNSEKPEAKSENLEISTMHAIASPLSRRSRANTLG